MPVELTPYNVDTVLGVYPERLYTVVPEVLEQLQDPSIDTMTLYTYCKAMHDQLEKDRRPEGHMGFNSFGESCFEGGIVKAFMKIAKDPKNQQDQFPALAAHFALQTFWMLMKTGTIEERKELLKQLYDEGAVDFCLNQALHAPLALHRFGAVNLLRCLSGESFLGEMISAAEAAKIISTMCEYTLRGPRIFIDQFGDARFTWQSLVCFGKFGTPRNKAAAYASRYYAMSQEAAAWTIQGLLLRCPPPNPSFCLEILKHDPSVIDLLFRAAAIKRPPWYAESAVDSIVAESIVMLFRVPDMLLGGVDVELPNATLQKENMEERAALLDCLRILIERPNWLELLHGVWNMIEDERPSEVKQMLRTAQTKYHAQSPYDLEMFLQIFEYRGSVRICMERLIATLSHLPECGKITDEDLLSLLHISNASVRPLPKSMEESIRSEVDQGYYLENGFELSRKPLYSVFTEDEVDYPLHIANEVYMGPTAHARLLTVFAQRGTLSKIAETTKKPTSLGSRITAAQLKKIGTPDSIRIFVKSAKVRVTKCKEEGTRRFRQDGEMDDACNVYCNAAELAKSLIDFDEATQQQYTKELEGLRREYVLCLGNAAEMALGHKLFERALFYACAAVNAAKSLPSNGSPEAVDASIREKNERRVQRAQTGLS